MLGRKICFVTKNSKLTKFSPNLLKFGLKVHNQVPCSTKEASAKIQSLSSLLRHLSALLVHAVLVVKSLSWSYDKSVSISMVLQSICQVFIWFVENEELGLGVFVSKCQMCAKGK